MLCSFGGDHPDCPLQPDILSLSLVALAHVRAGLVTEGLNVLSSNSFYQWRRNHPVTVASYTPCVVSAVEAGDNAGVMLIWRHMAERGIAPDDASTAAFIRVATYGPHPGALRLDLMCATCVQEHAMWYEHGRMPRRISQPHAG